MPCNARGRFLGRGAAADRRRTPRRVSHRRVIAAAQESLDHELLELVPADLLDRDLLNGAAALSAFAGGLRRSAPSSGRFDNILARSDFISTCGDSNGFSLPFFGEGNAGLSGLGPPVANACKLVDATLRQNARTTVGIRATAERRGEWRRRLARAGPQECLALQAGAGAGAGAGRRGRCSPCGASRARRSTPTRLR